MVAPFGFRIFPFGFLFRISLQKSNSIPEASYSLRIQVSTLLSNYLFIICLASMLRVA